MSMQKVSVMVPPLGPIPRGALWIGEAVSWLVGGNAGVQTALPVWIDVVRARFAVDRVARREARERADLMALARRYQATQPEFAKDLFAAASRDQGR